MARAWLLQTLWQRYEYGRDRAFLKSVYPLFADARLFYLDTLVTCPSISPENVHGALGSNTALCAGPTTVIQLLRDLFHPYDHRCGDLGCGRGA